MVSFGLGMVHILFSSLRFFDFHIGWNLSGERTRVDRPSHFICQLSDRAWIRRFFNLFIG